MTAMLAAIRHVRTPALALAAAAGLVVWGGAAAAVAPLPASGRASLEAPRHLEPAAPTAGLAALSTAAEGTVTSRGPGGATDHRPPATGSARPCPVRPAGAARRLPPAAGPGPSDRLPARASAPCRAPPLLSA